jgi:hypothetical protein
MTAPLLDMVIAIPIVVLALLLLLHALLTARQSRCEPRQPGDRAARRLRF